MTWMMTLSKVTMVPTRGTVKEDKCRPLVGVGLTLTTYDVFSNHHRHSLIQHGDGGTFRMRLPKKLATTATDIPHNTRDARSKLLFEPENSSEEEGS